MLPEALRVKGVFRHAYGSEGMRLVFRLIEKDSGVTVKPFASVVIDTERAFRIGFHFVASCVEAELPLGAVIYRLAA